MRGVGCAIVEVGEGGLRERGRIAPEQFDVHDVLVTEKRVWLFGSSDEDGANLVVADRATGAIRHRGKQGEARPATLIDIPGGGIGLHSHYTGSVFLDETNRVEPLFRQYEYEDKSYVETHFAKSDASEGGGDDGRREVHDGDRERPMSCMESCNWIVRHGDHLLATHGREELIVWRPRVDSVFDEAARTKQ